MRKLRIVLVLAALLTTQAVFADDQDMSSTSTPCGVIAKACLDAGYVRTETPDKKFWEGCMKPILLGHSVQGVTVDAATVKSCRANKIDELKKEMKEFQKVSKK